MANADSDEKTEFSSPAKKSPPQVKYSDSIRSYDESGAELGRQLTESEPAESPEGASHVDGFGVAGIMVDTLKDVGLDTDGEVVDFAETGQFVVEATERYRGDPDDVEDDPSAGSGEMPASYRESLRDNRRFADLAMPEVAEAPVVDDLTVATGAFFAVPATSNSGGEITGLASLESRLSTMDQAAMPGFANAEPANESRPTEVWKENDSYYKRLSLPPAPGTPAPGGSPFAGNSVAPKGASEFKSRSGKQQAAEWGIQTELSAMPGRSDAVEGGMVGFGASPGGGGALGGGMGGGAGYGGMVPPASGPAPSAPTETFGDNFDGSQNGRLTVFGRDAETTDDDPAQTEPGKFAFGGRQTTGVAGKNVTVNHYGYAPVTEGKAASAQALQEQNFNWAKGKEGEVLLFDVDAENEVRRERESSRAKSPRRGQAPASRRGFFPMEWSWVEPCWRAWRRMLRRRRTRWRSMKRKVSSAWPSRSTGLSWRMKKSPRTPRRPPSRIVVDRREVSRGKTESQGIKPLIVLPVASPPCPRHPSQGRRRCPSRAQDRNWNGRPCPATRAAGGTTAGVA